MENYCERLQRQIVRRDAALARMKGNINQAQDAVSRKIEHAKEAVNEKINQWKKSIAPANIVRSYPWGTALAALVAGFLAAPMIKSYQRSSHDPARESRWNPVAKALLASLPTLAATLLNGYGNGNGKHAPAKAEPEREP